LQNFDLRLKYNRSFEIQAVAPVRSRVESGTYTVAELQSLNPLQFEEVIRQLLMSMGYEATLTAASHDGGIDIDAFNSQPIMGGKLVVQCKRYAGTVGVAAVRDLYGAAVASKARGILITTSNFSPDATRFAHANGIELIDGPTLASLLSKSSKP
jgi:restriction system protein